LLEEILKSEVVVGCKSITWVIGVVANKRVISSIPSQGEACKLLHAEIKN